MDHNPLFSEDYLLSRWEAEFRAWLDSGEDDALRDRLRKWANRDPSLTETQLESQFHDLFFKQTWGYWGTGEKGKEDGYCLNAQYGVEGAGQTGGKGAADLALGWWGREDVPPVPQTLCEFKDIRSCLDAPQKRKGNDRSPVKQCFDYLKYAFDATDSHSTLTPTWGVVTDMNEVRLYARRVGDSHYQRFFIQPSVTGTVSLLDEGEAATFQRFLFSRTFHREMLLAEYGKSPLEKMLEDQWVREKELEKGFYREYQAYREAVFEAIAAANPGFQGTRGALVKLTQRFLDRCIFILFCEDMGKALDFPTDLLRDMLVGQSTNPSFSPDFTNVWDLVKQLFRTMRDGGPFPPDHTINRFNGGLFEALPELEALVIPNRVFCAKGQGESPAALVKHKDTLLYLAANYNFGAHGTEHQRTITLYALGRIFEQSITDLEYMEAAADAKETLATVNKRKRDGVYYTPEWVTDYIVKETVGARLADIRAELDLELGTELPERDVKAYRTAINASRRRKLPDNAASRMVRALDEYEVALSKVKVLDPACGSGAFLIQALQFLLKERRTIAEERARITGAASLFDTDASMRAILSTNLYGVDINPESVEITQLALWLNTALPGKPLSNLDTHIRCGNSLVGPDFEAFYQQKHPDTLFSDLDAQSKEDVNVFDWEAAFPEVFGAEVPEAERGFDCVIGNPPYVKLQNFRKVKPDESEYYAEAKRPDGTPVYESARSGNFDLYLPFIEKGISLLHPRGRMGFIAPSLWLKNEYGTDLRRKMLRDRCLDRWIDFRSFQVFSEATTYTAIQFFSAAPNKHIRFFLAHHGDIAHVNWLGKTETFPYEGMSAEEPWNLYVNGARDLITRLNRSCLRLDHPSLTKQIFQGLITSADSIYHLHRVAPNRYSRKGTSAGDDVYEIEDAIMHPLVSGPEAKRYLLPATDIYLLFPYVMVETKPRLLSQEELERRYPKAWAYLKQFEKNLRARERGKMDRDDCWWGYNYPKNLDKHERPKLLMPRLVLHLCCIADEARGFYLDNVDVGGVIPARKGDLWFLCGLLNAPVCDFVFRRTSKPFRGDYLSANKQFIAPLPIPDATDAEKAEVGERAKELQELHTARRDKMELLQRRLDSEQCTDVKHTEDWLWGDVKTKAAWKQDAPDTLPAREKMTWAKEQYETRLAAHMEKIDAVLAPGAVFSVREDAGEVRVLSDGVPIVTVYVEDAEASFLAAQWRQVARTTNVTEKFEAKTLIRKLLTLRQTHNSALRSQVGKIDADILALDAEIARAESEMNALVYRLYNLTEEEIKLVEAG